MLGFKDLAADFATTSTTFVTPDDGGTPAKPLAARFFVEDEGGMFVDLICDVVLSHGADTGVADLDFLVDGSRLGGADGLVRHTPGVADAVQTVRVQRTLKLAKGQHSVALQVKTNTGTLTLQGAGWPIRIVAFRNPDAGTLGHGVESKAQLVQ